MLSQERGIAPVHQEVPPPATRPGKNGEGTLDKWFEEVKKETVLHKSSQCCRQWAAVGRCQQVLKTKTLALEISPKEGAGAGYMGGKTGLVMRKQTGGTRV